MTVCLTFCFFPHVCQFFCSDAMLNPSITHHSITVRYPCAFWRRCQWFQGRNIYLSWQLHHLRGSQFVWSRLTWKAVVKGGFWGFLCAAFFNSHHSFSFKCLVLGLQNTLVTLVQIYVAFFYQTCVLFGIKKAHTCDGIIQRLSGCLCIWVGEQSRMLHTPLWICHQFFAQILVTQPSYYGQRNAAQ